MKLTGVRVQHFRNIVDSTLIGVNEDITCLVGKNESGKTAILQALYRLKPAFTATFVELGDYPRWLLSEHRQSGEISNAVPIEAIFNLEPTDIAAIEAVGGVGVLKDTESVSITRDYADKVTVGIGRVYEASAVLKLLTEVNVPETIRPALAKQPTLELLGQGLKRSLPRAATGMYGE